MRLVSRSLAAARTRAALAYAGIDIKKSRERVGISYSTMTRIVSPTNPRGWHDDEPQKIIDACGVPTWFLEHGWHPPAEALEPGDHETRLGALEDDVTLLLEAAGAQAPEGELAQQLRDALTNRRSRERRDWTQEPGAPEGNGGS